MTKLYSTSRRQKAKLDAVLRNFAREEDGLVTVLACFMILMMLLVGGIGVDLMLNEMERVRVQNISDRAVLAAADLDQELGSEPVVEDYFRKSSPLATVNSVTVDKGLNYRTVCVNADSSTPTRFMKAMGVAELPVPGRSCAEERINKVEISLVVDISGSMGRNSKMENLQDAAKVFIDTVIRPETQDQISVSLIPYSEHVNAGPDIMDHLNMNMFHNWSNCVEFDNSDFNSVRIDRSKTYDQVQHFQWTDQGRYATNETVCPRFEFERITPFSQNAQALKDQIDSLRPRVQTSIFLGMKWAVGLLDPDFQDITSSLSNNGVVDSVFSARPSSYEDKDTLKTVILMTDGQNTDSQRIADSVYNSNSEITFWDNNNFGWYLKYRVSSRYRDGWYWEKYSGSEGDSLLANICDAAKEKRIVVWTIGFEVTTHSANVMRDCASSPSHFFEVAGIELTEAFEAIARQINQLRLIQ